MVFITQFLDFDERWFPLGLDFLSLRIQVADRFRRTFAIVGWRAVQTTVHSSNTECRTMQYVETLHRISRYLQYAPEDNDE